MEEKSPKEQSHGTIVGGTKAARGMAIVMGGDSRACSSTTGKLKSDSQDKLFFLKKGVGVLAGTGYSSYIKQVREAVNEEIMKDETGLPFTSQKVSRILVKQMQRIAEEWSLKYPQVDSDDFEATFILGMFDYLENGKPKACLKSFHINENYSVSTGKNEPFVYAGCYKPNEPNYLKSMYSDDRTIEHAVSTMDVFIGLATEQAELDEQYTEDDAGIGGLERICVIQPRMGRCVSFEKSCTLMEEDISDIGYRVKVCMGQIKRVVIPPTAFVRDADQKRMRKIDMKSKPSKRVYKGDCGSLSTWPVFDGSMLKESKLGAYEISLKKNGLASPSYSDSPKVAYVLKGSGTCGIILRKDEKQQVIPIIEGDAIALPSGVVTWWLNKQDVDLVILFMGDTSEGLNVGEFSEFPRKFSQTDEVTSFTDAFVQSTWDVREGIPIEYTGIVMVTVDDKVNMPEADDSGKNEVAINCLRESHLKNRFMVLNSNDLRLVAQAGISCAHIRIDAKSMFRLGYCCDSAYQAIYIVRGKGCAEIVGVGVMRKLQIEAGNLLIVPKNFLVSIIAGGEGLDLFSIITTPNPVFSLLAGSTSVWKLSPEAKESSSFKKTGDEMFFPAA